MAQLTGSMVAIVTPMHDDGSLDFDAFRKLIDWHIAEGTDGIVVVGTTGESPTVDFDEHHQLIQIAVEHAKGRIPIIAGTGANSTREAIELAAYAKKAGAGASLSVVPYYNKPTQEGLYRHFRAIAEAVEIPQIVYNVPGRTVADLQNDTMLRLAEVPNIVGLKDATANLERGAELLRQLPPRTVPSVLLVFGSMLLLASKSVSTHSDALPAKPMMPRSFGAKAATGANCEKRSS